MKLGTLGIILGSIAVSGCAPQFIEVPPPQKKAMWVERDAITSHAAIANSQQPEVVLTNEIKDRRLNSEERVTWVSGVDLKNSRLQRTSERLGEAASDSSAERVAMQASIVEAHSFAVVGSVLGTRGQLALQKFKATDTARYYVEFLNVGPMTEESVEQMAAAWKQLAPQLKSRGLNTSALILGGAKYEQAVNAIVLVKVGK